MSGRRQRQQGAQNRYCGVAECHGLQTQAATSSRYVQLYGVVLSSAAHAGNSTKYQIPCYENEAAASKGEELCNNAGQQDSDKLTKVRPPGESFPHGLSGIFTV
eukprot:scpid80685/ scgid14174/ 